MKFLALLRDSLKEAIDLKIFYVLAAVSLVLTLLAFSLGFKPRPAEESLEWICNSSLNADIIHQIPAEQANMAMLLVGKLKRCALTDVVQLDKDLPPQQSRYQFTLSPYVDPTNRQFSPGLGRNEEQLRQTLGKAGTLQMFELQELRRISADKDRYVVTIAPTPATRMAWLHEFSLFFGAITIPEAAPVGTLRFYIEEVAVVNVGGWITLLVSVIITAFFIPNMLRKGTIEPLLVKPIRRWQLLTYKYIGGLTFILLNTTIAIGGIWLALCVRSGVWTTGLLFTIPTLTFYFAILYSFSTLMGVLTQNPVGAILLTCGAYVVLFVVGVLYEFVERERVQSASQAKQRQEELGEEGGFAKTVRVVHAILPRTRDLTILNSQLLRRELFSANQMAGQEIEPTRVSWSETILVSLIFIAVMLSLACWRFGARDY